MLWENISEENCAVYECTSLITNALTINSNGMSSRGRRLDIAPLNFDDSSNSPVKMSSEEMSLYSGNTPQGSPRPCSISSCLEMGLLSPLRENEIIEERHDFDFNSMDSGFSNNGCKIFTFVQPNALPPKPSPPKNVRTSPKSISCFRSYNSLSSDSMESMDDDCMDLLDMESMDDNAQLPTSFNSIISGNIKSTTTSTSITQTTTPVFRRCLSMTDGNVNRGPCTPDSLKTIPEMESKCNGIIKTFKRPEPPTIGSPIQSKRYKQSGEDKENSNELPITRPVLRKSMSMNDDLIMNALSRSSSEPHLIGDFSRPFCLPLTFEGRHSDLKSISVHTMAELLRGEYKESVASFKVIDCRYPYEFEGGHIRGAQNLYTQDLILTELVNSKTDTPKLVSDEPMRNIIVFHCEFSSERGPKLSRFLRNNDRSRNEHVYPALHYPEIYLLHGGYKDFFEKYPELCDPINYRQMLDPNFSSDYRQFRAKSKSWNGDQKTAGRSTNRLVKTKSRNLIY
ncbi:M-phase inducer phosphatase-like isoform X2 [Contarinia nasturtii]|uniref:M-phase inducer phosphatase-like isoform X2 n=1 Tax=Contarinia nasturtii TaxID=265458 RepID=UPI0012D46DB7|nr:M-phase inducer phosphatase-like isoform X2 [Contarinia nasturtii]